MSKIHSLSGFTSHLHSLDDLLSATSDDSPFEAVSAPGGALPSTLTQVLYSIRAGDTGAISLGDINQGQIGDCFLLSSIGEIARLKPAVISNMIHVNANGTETVMLYEASNGRLPNWNTTTFKPVAETISNVFPNYSVNSAANQDVVNGQREIWPQVLEKAVATLDGGYAAIMNGGSPVIAMEELTGHAATYMSAASLTLAALQSFVAAGDMIVMDTLPRGALPNGLFNNHAYMFEGLTGSGASATVHLGNPWGFGQPAPMLLSQLSRGFAEVDIGRLA